jgi:hypothetical protein
VSVPGPAEPVRTAPPMAARGIGCRLVFVDGLPGSGKSSVTQRLYLALHKSGHDVRWYFEGVQPHPIHEPDTSGVWLSEATLQAAWSRWEQLTASLAAAPRRITLFDGTLFQQTVGGGVLMDLEARRIVEFVLRIDERLRDLGPALLYLYQDDPSGAIRRICAARGQEWTQFIQGLIAVSPYGRRHRLATLDGVVDYYLRCRAICDEIVPRLGMRVLPIETSNGNWPEVQAQAARFVGLVAAVRAEPVALIRACAGLYREASSGHQWTLVQDETGLRFDDTGVRLLHKENAVFLAEATGIELSFIRDASGLATRIECTGSVPGDPVIGRVWHRVRTAGAVDASRGGRTPRRVGDTR